MPYYRDLTPYTYRENKEKDYIDKQLINVGWLSFHEPFNKGAVHKDLIYDLFQFIATDESYYKHTKNRLRGSHYCEFCLSVLSKEDTIKNGGSGNGEIHIPTRDGKIYIAPVLIYHYIKVHGYKPPDEFISAVLKYQICNWCDYKDSQIAIRNKLNFFLVLILIMLCISIPVISWYNTKEINNQNILLKNEIERLKSNGSDSK